MAAWCEGADFEALRGYTTLDDGDVIRTFRIVADLLRQLCRSIPEPDLRQRVQHDGGGAGIAVPVPTVLIVLFPVRAGGRNDRR